MLFAIIGHDGPEGWKLRQKFREAHLKNLQSLVEKGKVVLAGPFTDGSGSLIVIDMESEGDAIAFAHSDPYAVEGVFERVEIKPFRKVLPKE